MKALIIGLTLVIFGVLISVINQDWSLLLKISGTFGIVILILSGVLSGAFVSGDRIRANYQSDTTNKSNLSLNLFLIAIPNLIAVIVYVSLAK